MIINYIKDNKSHQELLKEIPKKHIIDNIFILLNILSPQNNPNPKILILKEQGYKIAINAINESIKLLFFVNIPKDSSINSFQALHNFPLTGKGMWLRGMILVKKNMTFTLIRQGTEFYMYKI